MNRYPIERPAAPRPSIPDAYRGYPAEYPSTGQTWFVLAVIVGIALLGVVLLLGWALS